MADGERFQEATLAFFNMALFTGPLPPDGGIVPIDADGFLQQLRWAVSLWNCLLYWMERCAFLKKSEQLRIVL